MHFSLFSVSVVNALGRFIVMLIGKTDRQITFSLQLYQAVNT